MKNRRHLNLVLLCFLCPLASDRTEAQSTVSNDSHRRCSVPPEEIQVFREYLSHEKSAQVVETETDEKPRVDVDSLNLQLAAQGRGIPQDVREDFKRKNNRVCNIIGLKGIENVIGISRADPRGVFKGGWTEFHKNFGKNASMLTFSRVGFSSDKRLALLHVSSGIGPMAAGGMLYLLERRGDKWVIKTQVTTWTT